MFNKGSFFLNDNLKISPFSHSEVNRLVGSLLFSKTKPFLSKHQKHTVLFSGAVPAMRSTVIRELACPVFSKPLMYGLFHVLFCTFPRALETNKYNHITATYFLLAERILREKQEKEIQTRSASPSNIKAQFR